MKKTYIRPQIMIEAFTPNNYVAACYKIACNIGGNRGGNNNLSTEFWNNNPEYGHGRNEQGIHAAKGTAGTCADENSNRILTDAGGLLSGTSVGEYNKDQGWLNGTIEKWTDSNGNGKVDEGDIIYWSTTSSSKRWNHRGTIQGTVAGHPNHS